MTQKKKYWNMKNYDLYIFNLDFDMNYYLTKWLTLFDVHPFHVWKISTVNLIFKKKLCRRFLRKNKFFHPSTLFCQERYPNLWTFNKEVTCCWTKVRAKVKKKNDSHRIMIFVVKKPSHYTTMKRLLFSCITCAILSKSKQHILRDQKMYSNEPLNLRLLHFQTFLIEIVQCFNVNNVL